MVAPARSIERSVTPITERRTMTYNVGYIIGSLSSTSINRLLAKALIRLAPDGLTFHEIPFRDLPLYSPDLDADPPPAAIAMKAAIAAADAVLIVTPEYNRSIPGGLKNALDWISRQDSDGEPALSAITGKTAVLCSASPGGLGGLRGLVHLRAILGNIGVTVLPDQVAVGSAHSEFRDDGTLTDDKQSARVRGLGASLAKHLAKLLA